MVLTNIIRDQNTLQIKKFTTPYGHKQITRDMFLSRNDTRLKLVRFETQHLRRAIPMNVATKQNYGNKKESLIFLNVFFLKYIKFIHRSTLLFYRYDICRFA